MEERVEARSLSAINFLAANPPQYPLNPTEEARESLLLYISRVPGSRDVILSPFKPRRKNVTGDDIANALYYVHLDAHSDERLIAPALPNSHGLDSPRSSIDSSHNNAAIHRKPLPPSSAKLSHLQSSTSEDDVLRHSRPPADTSNQLDDAPLLPPRPTQQPDNAPLLPPRPAQQRPQSTSAPIPRKPLGPRQMGQPRSTLEQDPQTQSKRLPQRRPADPPSPPPLRTEQPAVEPGQFATTQPYLDENPPVSPTRERAHATSFAPFCLSLIRRDPSSGYQWNVGKVTSLQPTTMWNGAAQDENEPSAQNVRHPQGQPTISVHIETSGYAKFRGMPTRRSVEAFRPGSSSSLPQTFGAAALGFVDGSSGSPTKHQPRHVEEGFNRQVVMSYTKSWAANIRDAFKRSSRSHSTVSEDDDNTAIPLPPQAPFLRTHSRQDSGSSMFSVDSAKSNFSAEHAPRVPGDQPPIITQAGPGLKARGYFFTSPWDGRCEFRTGRGGRSLSCALVFPPASSGFNPLVTASQGGRSQHGRSRQGSLTKAFGQGDEMPVSELRFNLPGGDRFKKATHHGDATDFHGRLDKLLSLGNREEDSGDEDSDEDIKAFYMSLGREKAGGGNRGKRAKLGKLIIHDEGLKMLDLVVAANMGVWWGTWEKSA